MVPSVLWEQMPVFSSTDGPNMHRNIHCYCTADISLNSRMDAVFQIQMEALTASVYISYELQD